MKCRRHRSLVRAHSPVRGSQGWQPCSEGQQAAAAGGSVSILLTFVVSLATTPSHAPPVLDCVLHVQHSYAARIRYQHALSSAGY